MSTRFRAAIAGVVGGGVAFGLAELAQGLYELIPSIPIAVSQRVIELTPGGLATEAIGTLGSAATPILVSTVVLATLAFCGLLGVLSRYSTLLGLGGAGLLAAVALLAAFSEPFVAPVFTVLTVLGALGAGTAVAGFLLASSGLGPAGSGTGEAGGSGRGRLPEGVRAREAYSGGGIAVDRRSFLLLSGGAAAVGILTTGAGRLLSGSAGEVASTGASGAASGGGAAASTVETLPSPPPGASIEVPGMPDLITPSDDFYLIDTAISSPRINRDRWSLDIGGAVDNPIELSYEDLLSLPARESDITLSCVSNEVGGGLISHGRWTGVLLSDVLAEAGVARDKLGRASEQLIGRSADGWEAGFRTELALDGREALVVFGLNGDELPTKHGYPVRLVVPGLYGYISATKWLTEIELVDWDYDVYWIRRGWAKEGPVKTQSRIDTVSNDEELSAGTVQIGGVAWAPTRGIERVEVSTDDGDSWNDARLAEQLDEDAWRQYVYEWDASPGDYTIQVRATDGEGETQTEEETEPIPSGATGHHTISVTVR